MEPPMSFIGMFIVCYTAFVIYTNLNRIQKKFMVIESVELKDLTTFKPKSGALSPSDMMNDYYPGQNNNMMMNSNNMMMNNGNMGGMSGMGMHASSAISTGSNTNRQMMMMMGNKGGDMEPLLGKDTKDMQMGRYRTKTSGSSMLYIV
jgi:hypothetical protein